MKFNARAHSIPLSATLALDARAKELIAQAEGYRISRINRAKGDASRFRAMHREYRRAPEVTRTRLYLEGMAEVLGRARNKIIIDQDAQGLVPLLNLQDRPSASSTRGDQVKIAQGGPQ